MTDELNIPPGHFILPMTEDDLEEVLRIEGLSFKNPWTKGQFESEFGNPLSFRYTLKVTEGQRQVIAAYMVFWIVHGEAHILNICTNPEYRSRGFASELMAVALAVMKRNQAYEVFLEVRRSNDVARRLYSRFGFKAIFERKNYYGDEDAIVMSLDI